MDDDKEDLTNEETNLKTCGTRTPVLKSFSDSAKHIPTKSSNPLLNYFDKLSQSSSDTKNTKKVILPSIQLTKNQKF